MLISSDIYGLLEFYSFLIWFFYGLDIVALLVIRYKIKKNPDPKQTAESDGFKLKVCLKPFVLFLGPMHKS